MEQTEKDGRELEEARWKSGNMIHSLLARCPQDNSDVIIMAAFDWQVFNAGGLAVWCRYSSRYNVSGGVVVADVTNRGRVLHVEWLVCCMGDDVGSPQ